MRIRLNDDSLSLLRDNRIFTSPTADTTRLAAGSQIQFDESALVEPYCGILEGDAICTMGSFSYSWSRLEPSMKIGRYCSIAGACYVPWPRHPIEKISTSSVFYDGQFSLVKQATIDANNGYSNYRLLQQKEMPVVGNDVWIGAGVSIMPGVTIGSGSVIAARSVVVKDVPPYAIVGGNPAHVIRMRFDSKTINSLLEVQWWRYRFTDFHGLNLDNPGEFAKQIEVLVEDGLAEYRPSKIRLSEMPYDEEV